MFSLCLCFPDRCRPPRSLVVRYLLQMLNDVLPVESRTTAYSDLRGGKNEVAQNRHQLHGLRQAETEGLAHKSKTLIE